jgi:hypothetical protein
MDQDTSNSPGKARWRERLGMGSSGKDMPKISDEFKPSAAPVKPAPRAPQPTQAQQPVTRPAPMAPRTPAPMAPRVPPRQAPQAQAPQAQAKPQPRPVAPLPQGAAGLGDRLRAERQAAERLAEQRVAQARGGINRPMTPAQAAPPPAAPPPQSQRPAQPERPKFSFSAEELAKDKRESVPAAPPPPEREYPTFSGKTGGGVAPPPLTPPRPALGGNAAVQPQRPQPAKPQASPPPAAGPAFQPRYGTPPQPPAPNYRSLDPPAGGGFTPKSRPYADTAAFREDPLARRDVPPRPQPPVNREYDSYRRPPALPPVSQQAYGDELDGPALPDYRRRPPVPARGRQQPAPAPAYDEDVNEVFEDEEPPRPQRRRASAQDYNRAYRDYEEGYEAEPRRRRGPWPWLALIALMGIMAAGVIYYYLTYMKQSGEANNGNVPVIEAPDSSSKTAPENVGGSLGSAPGTNPTTDAQRKQIYDRILGDDEVNGNQNQVVPTQEQPQAVEPTGSSEGQGAAPLPTPSSGTQDNSSEPLPLPLPPPGATDQQGSLQNNTNQQTAAMGAVDQTTAPAPEPASTTASDGGAPVPGQLAKATEQIASAPPPAAEQVVSDPEELPPPAQPAKPKLKAEKKPVKKTAAVEDAVDTGSDGAVEPLVLVPPAQPPVATPEAPIAQPEPAPQATESAASEQKSRSFFNSLGSGPTGKRKLTGKAAENAVARGGATGNWANAPDPNAVQADSSGAEPQQIAAITPAPEPQQPVQKAKPSGGGFTAQLASFRSEAEAQAEFDRLRAKHGGVLSGFNPRIVKATVAGSSRYRLSVGPMASRAQASKVCDSLIAGGERDCLVRGN